MPLTARVWDGVDELKRRKLLVLAAIAGVLAAACSGAAGFDGIPTYEIDRDAYKTPVARAIELERLVQEEGRGLAARGGAREEAQRAIERVARRLRRAGAPRVGERRGQRDGAVEALDDRAVRVVVEVAERRAPRDHGVERAVEAHLAHVALHEVDLEPLAASLVAFLALAWLPWALSEYHTHILALSAYYVVLAVGWNLLAGYTGQFSLAHHTFAGIGAYTSALLVQYAKAPILVGVAVGVAIFGDPGGAGQHLVGVRVVMTNVVGGRLFFRTIRNDVASAHEFNERAVGEVREVTVRNAAATDDANPDFLVAALPWGG